MIRRMVELKANSREYFMVVVNHCNKVAPTCETFLRIDGNCINLKSVLGMVSRVGMHKVIGTWELIVENKKTLDPTIEVEEADQIISFLERDPEAVVAEWKNNK